MKQTMKSSSKKVGRGKHGGSDGCILIKCKYQRPSVIFIINLFLNEIINNQTKIEGEESL